LNLETGTIAIEFVLHGDSGPASAWAGRAKVGDLLGLGIRTGKKATTADWYLFAGDETALPAIAAQIASLPAHAKGVALLEVNSEEGCFELSAPPGLTISWLFRRGIAPAASDLLCRQLSETTIPAAPLCRYIWVAGEAAMINQVRAYAKTQLDLVHGELHATVYWSAGISEDELGKSR
jgi:NADPH-dependent ferric siderophore reductase